MMAVSSLAITEIMYAPVPPAGGKSSDYEFLEIQNTTSQSLDISGYTFTTAITFTVPGGTSLAAGERAVLVGDAVRFAERYPGGGIRVLGQYTGNLSDGGEPIVVNPTVGSSIVVSYDGAWYSLATGGFSLILNDPLSDAVTWSSKSSWRVSQYHDGNPGLGDVGLPAGSIVVNELLAHTDQSLGDWVEFRNLTSQDINLGGWYLSDSSKLNSTEDDLDKYRIADGTILPANGYVSFTQFAQFGNQAAPGVKTPFQFYELGEVVALTSPDPTAGGKYGGFRLVQDFAAQERSGPAGLAGREITFGRYQKLSGSFDFVPLEPSASGTPAGTRNAANATAYIGPVVISEIMYKPVVGGDAYLELHNRTNAPVPLFKQNNLNLAVTNRWKIQSADWRYPYSAGTIDYTIPEDYTIPADGYVLVVANAAVFRTKYGIPESVKIFGGFTTTLGVASQDVYLLAPGDAQDHVGDPDYGTVPYYIQDRVKYNDSSNWPAAPNGQGPALARIADAFYANQSPAWFASVNGGSPGAANAPPVVSVSDVSTAEGNAGATNFVFQISVNRTLTDRAVINFATADGSATVADGDYVAQSGAVTIAAGQTSVQVAVVVNGDTKNEGAETFLLNIMSVNGAAVAAGLHGTGTIQNDDATSSTPWKNPVKPLDVNNDDKVQPLDVLAIIDEINAGRPVNLPPPSAGNAPPPYLDPTGDNKLTPADALAIIDFLNLPKPPPGTPLAGGSLTPLAAAASAANADAVDSLAVSLAARNAAADAANAQVFAELSGESDAEAFWMSPAARRRRV